jgi:hypothetical protein
MFAILKLQGRLLAPLGICAFAAIAVCVVMESRSDAFIILGASLAGAAMFAAPLCWRLAAACTEPLGLIAPLRLGERLAAHITLMLILSVLTSCVFLFQIDKLHVPHRFTLAYLTLAVMIGGALVGLVSWASERTPPGVRVLSAMISLALYGGSLVLPLKGDGLPSVPALLAGAVGLWCLFGHFYLQRASLPSEQEDSTETTAAVTTSVSTPSRPYTRGSSLILLRLAYLKGEAAFAGGLLLLLSCWTFVPPLPRFVLFFLFVKERLPSAWKPFIGTPISRIRAFTALCGPALILWVAGTAANKAVTFLTRAEESFIGTESGRVILRPPPFWVSAQTFLKYGADTPAYLSEDRLKASRQISDFLRAVYGVHADPAFLGSLECPSSDATGPVAPVSAWAHQVETLLAPTIRSAVLQHHILSAVYETGLFFLSLHALLSRGRIFHFLGSLTLGTLCLLFYFVLGGVLGRAAFEYAFQTMHALKDAWSNQPAGASAVALAAFGLWTAGLARLFRGWVPEGGRPGLR